MRRFNLFLKIVLLNFLITFVSCGQDVKEENLTLKKNIINMESDSTNWNRLTEEEKYVIEQKGTERSFTGIYVNHHDKGVYTCKRCNTPLFESDSKFDSGSGWPAFDNIIDGAVEEIPDTDGMRTEIICANCKAHLGHVFRGERFTPNNTRHCVNSISLNFIPQDSVNVQTLVQHLDTAIFASGCFWGTEYFFEKADGVISTQVGYIGGHKENPTYKDVCTGETGHAEAVRVVYDTTKTDYRTLCKLFFETHDPSQVDRQGPDVGNQYRSGIFYVNDEQKKVATELKQILEGKGLTVATEITKATTFWEGEDYHEHYYSKKGGTPYCHGYTKRFDD